MSLIPNDEDRARHQGWLAGASAAQATIDALKARLAEAESVIEAVATMYNGNPAKYAEAVSNAHSLADDYVMKYLSGADSAAVVRKRKSCPRCYGKSPLCHRCQGTGMIDAPTSADDPSCPECDGEGTWAK